MKSLDKISFSVLIFLLTLAGAPYLLAQTIAPAGGGSSGTCTAATAGALGCVQIGSGISVTTSGVISTSAASPYLSALVGSTTVNTIDNVGYAQTWTWNTLSTATALSLSSSSGTGTLLKLTGTGTETALDVVGNTVLGSLTTGALTVNGSGAVSSGTLANSFLSNSSMTLAGHSVSLGGTQTFACADLSNGATGCSTATGTSGATLPLLNGTNTWSGVQSFNAGDLSASNVLLTGSTEPLNGFYLPSASAVAASTSGVITTEFNSIASGVDYVTHTAGKSGTAPIIAVNGSTANQGLTITGTGTGTVTISAPATLSSTTTVSGVLNAADGIAVTTTAVFGGMVTPTEFHPAFSTSQTVDWSKGPSQEIDDTTATTAVTVTMSNGVAGSNLRLVFCNDGVTTGAVTFSSVKFAGGTQPASTTTSGKCDIWFFTVTVAAGGSAEYWLTGQTASVGY